MKLAQFLALLIFTYIQSSAQPSFELSFPMGISNYADNAVDDNHEILQSPAHSTYSFATGVNGSISVWSIKQFEFLIGFNYRSLQYSVNQELEQEGFSWNYRNISVRKTDHHFGVHLQPRINFFAFPGHSFAIEGKLGYLFPLRHEIEIAMMQESYFRQEVDEYEYHLSKFPGIPPRRHYSLGLAYTIGKKNLRGRLGLGYEYLEQLPSHQSNSDTKDWHFFYLSLGFKAFFTSVKPTNTE